MTRMKLVVSQLCQVRGYTSKLLDAIKSADWFRMPADGVTHVAWQVGHLAMAESRLALQRVRGQKPDDAELISDDFLALFGKGSVPNPDAAMYPTPEEIRSVFDGVHRQTVEELQSLPEAIFDESTDVQPHPMFNTKLGAVQWCALHEMSHAGQIGLLRRLCGNDPLW